jgi:hypothetical protein
MKRATGATSIAILKKYSVPSKLNAVAAKLLRIVYWVLKNNKEYQT